MTGGTNPSIAGKIPALRKSISFPVDHFADFRIQMLNWLNRFNIFCFLDNREYAFDPPAFECLAGAGVKHSLEAPAGRALDELDDFTATHSTEWIFGHLSYDLKNETAQMQSEHKDLTGFPELFFFIPEIVLQLDKQTVRIETDSDAMAIYQGILQCPATIVHQETEPVNIRNRFTREAYIDTVSKLKAHILRGDCYEVNFCQEFYATPAKIDPLSAFHRLTALSPNPFSAFYRIGERFCCCASPERFLAKKGNRLFSQPIKGTSKRNLVDEKADESARQYLLNSTKEKSENVMVVDLVRNDLSRVCEPGTVKVDELFGLYRFPQVHQMISTVSGKLAPGRSLSEILHATFPMGSMTGAPKIRVMQLIERYERTKRGLFSGAIGYIRPGNEGSFDFDFNVIIRSILYNAADQYLSFETGSAITFYSDPEQEYEECLLKAAAMLEILR